MVNHEMESIVEKIILYHGSPNENVTPQFGQIMAALGAERYGRAV